MLLAPRVFRRLCRARDVLSGDGSLSIREVAAEVGISQFHFIRQFEAVFGVTPHQFRTAARLDRARELLAADRSVTEVCFELGFSSLGSFSGLFTRAVGMQPSAYRHQRRALVQVRDSLIARIPGCVGMMTALPADAFRNSREATARRPGQTAASQ